VFLDGVTPQKKVHFIVLRTSNLKYLVHIQCTIWVSILSSMSYEIVNTQVQNNENGVGRRNLLVKMLMSIIFV
jgi:hypothetical protein